MQCLKNGKRVPPPPSLVICRVTLSDAMVCLYLWHLQAKYLAASTGKDEETVMRDFSRPKYFSAFEAAEYGIIDQVQGGGVLCGGARGQGGGGKQPLGKSVGVEDGVGRGSGAGWHLYCRG